jgi:hypothetical protein
MALSDDGQVLMQVTFTDLSSAVILVTIPEPSIASGLMIAAAIGLLMRRKRVS